MGGQIELVSTSWNSKTTEVLESQNKSATYHGAKNFKNQNELAGSLLIAFLKFSLFKATTSFAAMLCSYCFVAYDSTKTVRVIDIANTTMKNLVRLVVEQPLDIIIFVQGS
jgi:hypothetical protein